MEDDANATALKMTELLRRPLKHPLPVWKVAEVVLLEDSRLRRHVALPGDSQLAAAAAYLATYVTRVLISAGRTFGTAELHTTIATYGVFEELLLLIAERINLASLDTGRSRGDATGAAVKKDMPDFLAWSKGALLMKGEEKPRSCQMDEAIAELTKKMNRPWARCMLPGHPMPCMLAYAAAAHLMQFFVIVRVNGRAVAKEVSSRYDLRLVYDRVQVMLVACNVFRLFAGYAVAAPRVPRALGQVVGRPGEATTVLLDGYVHKCIYNFSLAHTGVNTLPVLVDLYTRIHQRHRGKIIAPYNGFMPRLVEDDTYIMHLWPVGQPWKGPPVDEQTARAAVRSIIIGLEALHSEGYVHRDVRWANTIFVPAEAAAAAADQAPKGASGTAAAQPPGAGAEEGTWMLIDLEHANLKDCMCGGEPFPLRYWQHDTLEPDGRYSEYSDMHMVATELLDDLQFQLGDVGLDLCSKLRQRQLTAAQALQHPWLA